VVCVMTGDCRYFLENMPRVHCVLCDPPYGADYYETDKAVDLEAVFKAGDVVAIFGWPESLCALCIYLGAVPDEWITWWPPNKCHPRASNLRGQEAIAIFGDPPGRNRIVRPRSRACRMAMEMRGKRVSGGDPEFAREDDVWKINAPGIGFNHDARLHPNEKPRELLDRLVLLCSNEGELVCDPTCGSGTAGEAAIAHGRRFIGIEIVPEWAELSRERLRAFEQGSTLEARRAGQAALFGGSL